MLKGSELKILFDKSSTGDLDARNKLFDIHIPLVHGLIRRYTSAQADPEDLFQEGSIGLLKALDRYDPQQGTKFTTYAAHFILGEIRSYLRNNGHLVKISRTYHNYINRLVKEKERMEQILMRHPNLDELSKAINLPREDIALLINEMGQTVLSFDDDTVNKHDETSNIDADDFFFSIRLKEVINKLMHKEKQVMVLRYIMDKSQKEVAELLGLSQSHVSRLEKKALKRLKEIDW